ncbi:hypothetical protein ACMXYV_08325 [Neptuniibacter sp. SY11_33]|uniref:hypothetical protein n=1 Tax=Neptuniibacter sp. SY11_33 TaxID=3398215 RepID=UPI0039F4E5EA
MTCITNVILTTAIQDGAWMRSDTGSVDILSDYLYRNYQGTRFSDVEVHAGGNKRMSCDVFMVAVDYLNVEEFIEQFHKVEWQKPEEAQLLIRTEGDTFFTSYRPKL